MDMFNNVLRSILGSEIPPTKVLDVKLDSYTTRDILYREDGMILYFPPVNSKKDKHKYEIVLHRPYTETLNLAFSLFRSDNKEEAEVRFINFKDKIPVFIEINKEMCNTNGLQKLCDTVDEHVSWSLAHLAAYFALHESFNNPTINSYLNSSDAQGMSPLQVAIKTCNVKTVQMLVAAQCSLEHLDYDANSVFHYAATTNKEIIMALSRDSTRCLNSRNKNGETPLHLACRNDKPECVKALLLAGADVNIAATRSDPTIDSAPSYVGDFLQDHPNKLSTQDMKLGGTPLHWSCSREVIEILLQKNCNINAPNFEGGTALHVMVMRNRLECVVALLSHQAEIDIRNIEGNTPLHIAVKQGNISIIQSLIVFGADFNIVNNAGATPRHLITVEQEPKLLYYLHAVGAKRCLEGTFGCTEGCRYNGTYGGIPPPPVMGPQSRDELNEMLSAAGMSAFLKDGIKSTAGGKLLCLDGGGIRGLILVQMLLELEKNVNKPIVYCFDWIAGTSTGGILALGLASGKTLKEILCLYFRMKEHTFVGSRPYPSEALENILKECFGTDTVMSDIKAPKVLITGVLADRKPVDLHLFRNYESPSSILNLKHNSPFEEPPPPKEQLLWQAGRATGAAPSYFRAFGRYLDGGLIANNPTLDAMTEIHEYNLALKAKGRESEAKPLSVVVSFGTGLIPTTKLKDIDVFRPERLWDNVQLIIGISALGALLVDQATAADGRVVDRARAWCSMIGVPYYRFSPQMSEDVAMDESSDEVLVKMLWESKVYMHGNMVAMQQLAGLLNSDQ